MIVNRTIHVREVFKINMDINILILRCYPTPSYDVEVDVNDDDEKDEDKDDKDRSINIIVVRCESSPWASKLPFTSPRVVVEPRMIFQFF